MRQIAGYVADYWRHVHRANFVVITLILSVLVWFNYHYCLNDLLRRQPGFSGKFIAYYFLFGSVFLITWLSTFVLSSKPLPRSFVFYVLLLLSPAIFAMKVSLQIGQLVKVSDVYAATVLQWPLKAVAVSFSVLVLWCISGNRNPPAGLSTRSLHVKPYVLLLLLMLPVVVIASQGTDFQHVYPKLQMIPGPLSGLQKLLFELSYGLDFFTIELFFRGFLVLIFIKHGGRIAILPMAVFYCTIHFGKPLAECISSYIGGLLLGTVVYNTGSIWGGLIIHLGIAWMMEIMGVLF